MDFFAKRPLCLLCTVAVTSAIAGIILPRPFVWAFIAVAFAAVAFLVPVMRKRRKKQPNGKCSDYIAYLSVCMLICAGLGLFSSARYYQGVVDTYEASADTGHRCTAEAVVVERVWSSSHGAGYIVSIEQFEGENVALNLPRADMLLECSYPSDLQPGFSVRITALAERLLEDSAGFAQRNYYVSRGVVLRLISEESGEIEVLDDDGINLRIMAARLNARLAARLTDAAGREAGGFLAALLLDRRDLLADSAIRDFRRIGISHMLALSGTHLSVLCGALHWLLGRVGLPKRGKIVVQMIFIAGYLLLTGFPRSLLRAGLMLILSLFAELGREETDPRTSLFAAVALVCLCDPAAILDISLWMSAFATLGILLLAEIPHSPKKTLGRVVTQALLMTAVANLMTLPFIWMMNGELSLLAIPANLLLSPVVSCLLLCAPVILLLGRFGGFIFTPIIWLARLMLYGAERLSRLRGITISLRDDFLQWLIPLFCLSCALLLILRLKRKRLLLLPVCVFVLVFSVGVSAGYFHPHTDMIYLANGRRDTLVLLEPSGALLCDVSDGAYKSLRSGTAAVRDEGYTELEALLLTHYHTKHRSAVWRLAQEMIIRRIYLPLPQSEQDILLFKDLAELAIEEEIAIIPYAAGELLFFGQSELCIYHGNKLSRSTQPLISAQVKSGGTTVTYIGASVHESNLAPRAAEMAAESKCLILGGHGPVIHSAYRWGALPKTEFIMVANTDTLSAVDLNDPDMAAAFLRCFVQQGGGRIRLH